MFLPLKLRLDLRYGWVGLSLCFLNFFDFFAWHNLYKLYLDLPEKTHLYGGQTLFSGKSTLLSGMAMYYLRFGRYSTWESLTYGDRYLTQGKLDLGRSKIIKGSHSEFPKDLVQVLLIDHMEIVYQERFIWSSALYMRGTPVMRRCEVLATVASSKLRSSPYKVLETFADSDSESP
ncbi:hypothetical protein FNV43_RR05888 [Rhamnella rubrinervis]|uniref:Uncharacterized protein n=1 Tax=Rhamnella rubrinervis TaxID=2594499 RepID=A0A8K0MKV8_9ROSA|nr:hypothetical protein FNV43_RR05888 [Rhamnella rubrinervis]